MTDLYIKELETLTFNRTVTFGIGLALYVFIALICLHLMNATAYKYNRKKGMAPIWKLAVIFFGPAIVLVYWLILSSTKRAEGF